MVLKVIKATMQRPNNGIPRRQDAPRAIFSIPQFLFSPQARNLYKLYFEQRGGVLLLTLSHHVLTSDFQSRPAVSFLATCPGCLLPVLSDFTSNTYSSTSAAISETYFPEQTSWELFSNLHQLPVASFTQRYFQCLLSGWG